MKKIVSYIGWILLSVWLFFLIKYSFLFVKQYSFGYILLFAFYIYILYVFLAFKFLEPIARQKVEKVLQKPIRRKIHRGWAIDTSRGGTDTFLSSLLVSGLFFIIVGICIMFIPMVIIYSIALFWYADVTGQSFF